MKLLKTYDICFTGLKEGEHVYNYVVDDMFFTLFDYSEINAGEVEVKLLFKKKDQMLILNFELNGKVTLMCDRCTDEYEMPVEGSNRLIIRFGEEQYEQTDEILIISDREHTINVSDFIMEFIELLVPQRRVHPEGECNSEMLESMNSYLTTEDLSDSEQEDEEDDQMIDPRWSALKGLTDNDD